jgi:methyl-accepting chemotaxis protein
MDSDGVVLWHGSEPNKVGEQIGFSRAQDLSRLVPDGQAYRIHEADASHTLLVMLPVEGQSSWIIALELPNAIVVDLALQSALPTLVLLTLVSLLALLGMAVSVRRFSTALDDLSAAVERIRQGDLSVPLMGSGEDEIGKLGRGIATMQHELQRRVDEQDRLLNVTRLTLNYSAPCRPSLTVPSKLLQPLACG